MLTFFSALDLDINSYALVIQDQFIPDEMPEVLLDQQYIHQSEDLYEHLNKLKLPALKELCKKKGLPISGKKISLIERLKANEEAQEDNITGSTSTLTTAGIPTVKGANVEELQTDADEAGYTDIEMEGKVVNITEEELYFAYISLLD